MEIVVSVRNFVEFVMMSGSIDNRYASAASATEGIRLHKKIQTRESKSEHYQSELSLKEKFHYKDMVLTVQGRADGIFDDGKTIYIHEIKSTKRGLETIECNLCHLAQAKVYAYIYSLQNHLESCDIQLNYIHVDSEEEKIFEFECTYDALEKEMFEWIEIYYLWLKERKKWMELRNIQIKKMDFPFADYRQGQRNLAVGVYRSIVEGEHLWINAPTGIGKTISTLFPSIKSMGEGGVDKIFYLSAKTVGKKVARDTIELLCEKGLAIKTVELSAKEKSCCNDEMVCNPEKCPYALNYYDKLKKVMQDLLAKEMIIDYEVLQYYGKTYEVCPFELSLDIALWVDIIIGDYNYVFDPKIQLKRFFEEVTERYVFLVDEAHNLLDRARSMYSAELSKQEILQVKKIMTLNSDKKLKKAITKLNQLFIELKKQVEEDQQAYQIESEKPETIYYALYKCLKECDPWLLENPEREGYDKVLEFYFNCHSYMRIYDYFGENYRVYNYETKDDFIHKLFCLDPSEILSQIYGKSQATILFSATLEPIQYYKDVLGGKENARMMRIESPFDVNNCLGLVIKEIKTTYAARERFYEKVAAYISETYKNYPGNYLAFFPSYEYMNQIQQLLEAEKINLRVQERVMSETEKIDYLSAFEKEDGQLLGLAVCGGIFSEGIDLEGDKLKGAFVVGVGLSKINVETDMIKDYFDGISGNGYEYAYMYPGFNKILQAAGRVIRTEKDKGTVFIMDERFSHLRYKSLFPRHWKHFKSVKSLEETQTLLHKFWLEKK